MNKDNKTTEYIKKLKDIKLSESSRARMESGLLEYARFHKVSEGVRVGEDGRSIEQVPQRTSLFNLFKQPKSMTAAIIAIALIAGGGTSYAAEGAVPGDFLYTVKTEVNENVKSAWAVSDEAEAKLQARLAAERLAEAETLAARGELTAEASTDISSRLKAHYDEAEKRSAAAEAKGDYESSATVRASLEGSLRAYASVLTDLNTRVSGNNGAALITDVRAYADAAAKAQTQSTATIEASVDVQAAAEVTVKRADNYIAEVKTKLARMEAEVSAEAYARTEARLNEAVLVQAEAKASLRAEAYRAAYTSAQTAIRIASEVEVMINSMLRLQIDVDLGTDVMIDGVLDTRTESNTDVKGRTESDAGTNDEGKVDSAIDVELDATTDTSVDTDVIDSKVEIDTSIRSSAGLSL